MSLDELYQELLLDYVKNPRGKGAVADPSAACKLYNPLCGDEVSLTIKAAGEQGAARIGEILYDGHGCSVSQASASILTQLLKGKTLAEARDLRDRFKKLMQGEEIDRPDDLGDALALEGVKKFAARLKCALLAWEALGQCLEKIEGPRD